MSDSAKVEVTSIEVEGSKVIATIAFDRAKMVSPFVDLVDDNTGLTQDDIEKVLSVAGQLVENDEAAREMDALLVDIAKALSKLNSRLGDVEETLHEMQKDACQPEHYTIKRLLKL